MRQLKLIKYILERAVVILDGTEYFIWMFEEFGWFDRRGEYFQACASFLNFVDESANAIAIPRKQHGQSLDQFLRL